MDVDIDRDWNLWGPEREREKETLESETNA